MISPFLFFLLSLRFWRHITSIHSHNLCIIFSLLKFEHLCCVISDFLVSFFRRVIFALPFSLSLTSLSHSPLLFYYLFHLLIFLVPKLPFFYSFGQLGQQKKTSLPCSLFHLLFISHSQTTKIFQAIFKLILSRAKIWKQCHCHVKLQVPAN